MNGARVILVPFILLYGEKIAMKRGDEIEIDIVDLDSKGDGRGTSEGRDVIVRRAVPGDRIRGRVVKKRRGRADVEITSFVDHGMSRKEAQCIHFGLCGGCRWQDLSYEDQLLLKERMVRNALHQYGFEEIEVKSTMPSHAPFFYRNKMEYSFGCDRDGNIQLGLHMRGRFNRVFDVESCHLQSPISNKIVQHVRRLANELELSAYDLKAHSGLLRFLVIRDAKNSNQVLVNLVVSNYPEGEVETLANCLREEVPEIDSFIITLHTGKAQVAKGEREFVLWGDGVIEESCGPIRFDISPQSFFQTNSIQAERLYNLISEWAGEEIGKTLDLYCGTGSISLHLAHRAEHVLGIEVVEEAVEDARLNAERNGVNNCLFVAGKAEDELLSLRDEDFDLVVVDPPRPGLHKNVLAALGQMKPARILYVSCNPQTLAENLHILKDYGYGVRRVQPVDMFPQTPHCEVVCEVERLD